MLRKVTASRLAAIVALLSFSAQADLGAMPQWTMVRCSGEEVACYDFTGAKALKLYDADAQQLDLKLRLCDGSLALERDAASSTTRALALCADGNAKLKAMVTGLQNERDEALRKKALADAHNIFGGGMAWLVAAAAVAFAGGFYLGHR